jgi:hypothetical protein
MIPEMTLGLAGLLDDTYLLLRILKNLDRGPDPFLAWDLDHPLAFLRRLIGEEVARKLDERSIEAYCARRRGDCGRCATGCTLRFGTLQRMGWS